MGRRLGGSCEKKKVAESEQNDVFYSSMMCSVHSVVLQCL
jgi:hypothetical protein